MDLLPIARIVAVLGLVLLILAGILFLVGRLELPLGKLPGDFVFRRGNLTCAVPLVSSLVFSILITLILNILLAVFRK
ncbi:MAG: DUF2905 domain-containing protein [Anaerolineales bacterium]|nr:MAG: DUF2905 domain-containing protein [Anaerolineales bacterium]